MEINNDIINNELDGKLIDNKEEEKINENEQNNDIINTNINIITQNNNNENIDTNNNIAFYQEINGINKIVDHLITIKYGKFFNFPYFIYGNIFHFFCPCKKFSSNKIKLSEMPTPPFAIVREECM